MTDPRKPKPHIAVLSKSVVVVNNRQQLSDRVYYFFHVQTPENKVFDTPMILEELETWTSVRT
jgi:hypothetical protein